METQQLFQAEIELVKSEGQKRIVRGYASTASLDQQGEEILQHGLDFQPLLKSGFLNYDHQYQELAGARMPIIVGYPTSAERNDRGWVVEGELLKSDDPNPTSQQIKLANELWELGLALQKSGRRALAYSVEGRVIERRGSKIVKAEVRHLAVTHKPVNSDCTIEVFAKSFCCGNCSPGHPSHKPGHVCDHGMSKALATDNSAPAGESGPLMLQNLERGMAGLLYGTKKCGCYDDSGRFQKGAAGALKHMTECLGNEQKSALKFLKGIVRGSAKRSDLAALVRMAGLAG